MNKIVLLAAAMLALAASIAAVWVVPAWAPPPTASDAQLGTDLQAPALPTPPDKGQVRVYVEVDVDEADRGRLREDVEKFVAGRPWTRLVAFR